MFVEPLVIQNIQWRLRWYRYNSRNGRVLGVEIHLSIEIHCDTGLSVAYIRFICYIYMPFGFHDRTLPTSYI